MVYYCLASLAHRYFIDMGYQPANRQTTPDFLVAATDPNARTACEGYENRVPGAPDEFAEHYRKSNVWQVNQQNMTAYLCEFVGKPNRAAFWKFSSVFLSSPSGQGLFLSHQVRMQVQSRISR